MDVLAFPLDGVLLLFVSALVSGFINTLAGGGGLISLPALFLFGLPPLVAMGTNKLQGTVGLATSTWLLIRKGKLDWRETKPLIITAFLGALIGAIAIQFINAKSLSFIIPIVLFLIAIYFLISPTPQQTTEPKISLKSYKNGVIPTIGFYDGFFGPGTGSFFALANVLGAGKDLVKASMMAKPLNFASNFASLIIFISLGKVVWIIGALMIVGQVIGSWLGSHFLVSIKAVYIRALIVFMCTAMLIRYAVSQGYLSF